MNAAFVTKMDEFDSGMLYIGCIGVNKSMRTLDLHTRSEVAKESIKRLCEANGIERIFETNRKDPVDHMLDETPNLEHSGTEVELDVTKTHFNVITKDTREVIVEHEIFNVSFASSGDPETSDFVAYVANDEKYGRACFVIKCSLESAKELLKTIAQGFKLRQQRFNHEYGMKSIGPFSPEQFNGLIRYPPKDSSVFESNSKINNENFQNIEVINQTRASLEKEPWFHGSYSTREASEYRLRQDGDFLVRESILEPGQFVLSVMNDGDKLHLLFDSMGKVRMKDTTFDNISHLVNHHLEKQLPIFANNRYLYLRNFIRPPPKAKQN